MGGPSTFQAETAACSKGSGVIHSKPFLFWYPPIFQTVTLRLRKE